MKISSDITYSENTHVYHSPGSLCLNLVLMIRNDYMIISILLVHGPPISDSSIFINDLK